MDKASRDAFNKGQDWALGECGLLSGNWISPTRSLGTKPSDKDLTSVASHSRSLPESRLRWVFCCNPRKPYISIPTWVTLHGRVSFWFVPSVSL